MSAIGLLKSQLPYRPSFRMPTTPIPLRLSKCRLPLIAYSKVLLPLMIGAPSNVYYRIQRGSNFSPVRRQSVRMIVAKANYDLSLRVGSVVVRHLGVIRSTPS